MPGSASGPRGSYAGRVASSARGRRRILAGRKSTHDGLLLETFGTLTSRNLKAVADQHHRLAHVAGQGPHLQRKRRVTTADRPARPERRAAPTWKGFQSALQS